MSKEIADISELTVYEAELICKALYFMRDNIEAFVDNENDRHAMYHQTQELYDKIGYGY